MKKTKLITIGISNIILSFLKINNNKFLFSDKFFYNFILLTSLL